MKEYRKVTRYFHNCKRVTSYFHNGDICFRGVMPWQAYVQDGLIFQADIKQDILEDADGKYIKNLGKGSVKKLYATEELQNSFFAESTMQEPTGDYLIEVCGKFREQERSEGIGYAFAGGFGYIFGDLDNPSSVGGISLIPIPFSYWYGTPYLIMDSTVDGLNGIALDKETVKTNLDKVYTVSFLRVNGVVKMYVDGESVVEAQQESTRGWVFPGALVIVNQWQLSSRLYLGNSANESTIKQNYEIDQKRFTNQIPTNALVDADGNVILDAEGNYIIDNN